MPTRPKIDQEQDDNDRTITEALDALSDALDLNINNDKKRKGNCNNDANNKRQRTNIKGRQITSVVVRRKDDNTTSSLQKKKKSQRLIN